MIARVCSRTNIELMIKVLRISEAYAILFGFDLITLEMNSNFPFYECFNTMYFRLL